MGTDYSVAHAAALASQLPRESRCLRQIDPDFGWSDETFALIHLDYLIRLLIYGLAGAKGEVPKPIKTPSEIKHMRESLEAAETEMAEVAAFLGIEVGA